MDGIAAAQEMRDRWQLPVVVLTAHSEDSSLDRAKRTEPFGYLLKPFDDRELKSTIEMALYRHRSEVEIRRLNRLYAVLSQVQHMGRLIDDLLRFARMGRCLLQKNESQVQPSRESPG
jgi:AmiR/NasT family two-component response regulator